MASHLRIRYHDTKNKRGTEKGSQKGGIIMKSGFIVVTAYHFEGDEKAETIVSPVYLDVESAQQYVKQLIRFSKECGVLATPHEFDSAEWRGESRPGYESFINIDKPDRWIICEIYEVPIRQEEKQ